MTAEFSLHHCRTIAAASSLARLTGMSLASAFYRDERGTDNRSPEDLKSSMTVQQYIADLEELVDAVCTRIGQNKVAIMNKEARGVGGRAQRAARSCHAP